MTAFWRLFGLRSVIVFCAVVVGMPLVMMAWAAFDASAQDAQVWQHVTTHVLGDYMSTTLMLAVGVGVVSALLWVWAQLGWYRCIGFGAATFSR